ncbi:phage capsid protein [Roseibium album]|uniref:phage capsid protein n=1 Tax=Roseibium album TaxID=311410 RepID=UPI00249107B5|nr:phage capsid protein [Roseibium album]
MTDQAANWYKELIRAQIRERNKVRGGFLDDTMTRGDGHAGRIKFPVVGGEILIYKLSGAIQKVKTSSPSLSMVETVAEDYEGAAWMRVQDWRKQGPSEQSAVGKEMQKAIRFKRDTIKIDAMNAFATDGSTLPDAPTTVDTIGDGSTIIDLIDVIEARTAIMGTGTDEDLFFPIPEAWMDQLEMYKEFSNMDYIGDKELPFARMSNVRKRTFRGVHMFTLPDKYFYLGTGAFGTGTGNRPFDTAAYLDTFMWTREAMGAEMEWNQEDMSITMHPEMEGTPMLGKVGLAGAAVGVLPEGIKRMRFRAQLRASRPA